MTNGYQEIQNKQEHNINSVENDQIFANMVSEIEANIIGKKNTKK